jgi:hypothetical protein
MKKTQVPALVLIFLIVAALVTAVNRAAAQNAAADNSSKTAEQVFKNIQVLKGIPADQLAPTMQFIAGSLGVECTFCHVQNAFEKDDKKSKLTARKMIAMQMAINKDHFDGDLRVTCNSCHHGAHEPAAIPAVAEEEPKRAEVANTAAKPELPSADQILDKYLQAVGGAEAVKKVTSRVSKGTIDFGGGQVPVTIVAKAPNKRISTVQLPNGEAITAFDGHAGWLGSPGGGGARDMTADEVETIGLDAAFYLPVEIKNMFTQFFVRPAADKVEGHEVYQVIGAKPGKPPLRFFFDKESGLLLRTVRYSQTPLGRNQIQVDLTDYRSEGGVKIPFQWSIARPLGRFTIKLNDVQQNVPIEDAKFQKPAAAEQKPAEQKPVTK